MQDGTPIIIKKKKVSGHGHHGGAWKVAYADFVTAMMAFFMVMWIMGMSQEDRNIIQQYFDDPTGFDKRPPRSAISVGPAGGPRSKKTGEAGTGSAEREADKAIRLKNELKEKIEQVPELKKLMTSHSIEVKVNKQGVMLEFSENETNGEVFFEIGSANVRPSARQLIATVAPLLASTNRPLIIKGHTDSRQYGSQNGYDNFSLSSDRADAVRLLLQGFGVNRKQVLNVVGCADTEPRVKDDPYHFSNRRVSVLLPYALTQQESPRLPADELKQSVEGMFRLPDGDVIEIGELEPKAQDAAKEAAAEDRPSMSSLFPR